MKKLIYILYLLPFLSIGQIVPFGFFAESGCTALPLAGNGNAEEVFKSWSMDNAYDGTDPTECGTGDNCINLVGSNTYSFDTAPSENNIYCVNEGIKLVSTSASSSSMQINFDLSSGTTYDYALGIYQEIGTGGRVNMAFGITNETTTNTLGTVEDEWEWFTGSFDANASNSQMNIYSVDGSGSIGDTVWYVIQIKAQ